MLVKFIDMKFIEEVNESYFGEVIKEVCNCLKSLGEEKRGFS